MIDADELAAVDGTISWDVLAGVTARVPRLYLRGRELVATTTLVERNPAP
jgi:alanine racemase